MVPERNHHSLFVCSSIYLTFRNKIAPTWESTAREILNSPSPLLQWGEKRLSTSNFYRPGIVRWCCWLMTHPCCWRRGWYCWPGYASLQWPQRQLMRQPKHTRQDPGLRLDPGSWSWAKVSRSSGSFCLPRRTIPAICCGMNNWLQLKCHIWSSVSHW